MRFFLVLLFMLASPSDARAVPPPDPSRFADEIRAFDVADSLAPAPRGAVVFYGSSSIRMWPALQVGFGSLRCPVVGRGFGGSTMSEAAHWVNRAVVPLRPRAVVLYEGDNDLEMGRTPAQVVADFDRLVSRLRTSLPDVRLFVLSIKPSPARWSKWRMMQKTNALLAARCRRPNSRMTFVDVATPLLDASGRPRSHMYLDDGLHLSHHGYGAWQYVVISALAKECGRRPLSGRETDTEPIDEPKLER